MPLCSSCIKTIAKTWKLSSLQLIFNDMPSLDCLPLNLARLLGNHRLHINNPFPPVLVFNCPSLAGKDYPHHVVFVKSSPDFIMGQVIYFLFLCLSRTKETQLGI